MFRLTPDEWAANSSQIVMSSTNRPKSALPYAFTEHGVTMLASVLRSEKARKMNIAIVRAFISLKKWVMEYSTLVEQLTDLKNQIASHDVQLSQIYDAIENLLDNKAEEKKWEDRERIGFKK